MKQIPLSEAAMRLGIDYQQCRRLVLTGGLKGGRDAFGRLYVLERGALKSKKAAARDLITSKAMGGRNRA